MNKDKEIEDIQRILFINGGMTAYEAHERAKSIVEAHCGYAEQAVKEFAEKLKAHQWLAVTVDKFVVCVDEIDKLINDIYEEEKERNE